MRVSGSDFGLCPYCWGSVHLLRVLALSEWVRRLRLCHPSLLIMILVLSSPRTLCSIAPLGDLQSLRPQRWKGSGSPVVLPPTSELASGTSPLRCSAVQAEVAVESEQPPGLHPVLATLQLYQAWMEMKAWAPVRTWQTFGVFFFFFSLTTRTCYSLVLVPFISFINFLSL
jgi:hypothetical protein